MSTEPTWSLDGAAQRLPAYAAQWLPKGASLVQRDKIHLLAGLMPHTLERRGIVVVSGPAGSGKTTTVAAVVGVAPVRAVYVALPPKTRDKMLWENLAGAIGATAVGTQRQLQDAVQAQLATQPTMLVVDEAQNVGLEALKALRWLTGQLTCPFAMVLSGIDLNQALGKEPMLASRVSARVLLRSPRFGDLLPELRSFHPVLDQVARTNPALLGRVDSAYAHGSWRAWSLLIDQLNAFGYTTLNEESAADAIELIAGSRPW